MNMVDILTFKHFLYLTLVYAETRDILYRKVMVLPEGSTLREMTSTSLLSCAVMCADDVTCDALGYELSEANEEICTLKTQAVRCSEGSLAIFTAGKNIFYYKILLNRCKMIFKNLYLY